MSRPDTARSLLLIERLGVALLLVAALVPRVRGISSSFDRELEGFQASLFAAAAVNYERLGVMRFGGYPVFTVDVPSPGTIPYLYPNHPPLVPLVAWSSLKLFGPTGWNEAWRDGDPPGPIEVPLRLPFLLAHMAGLLGLWWAVRQASGAQLAFLTLALAATSPVSTLYSYLVNYENPCFAFLLFGLGFHARWLRDGARRDLVGTALLFFLAATVTYTPAFFLVPAVAHTLVRRGARKALLQAALVGAATLLPLVCHALWVRAVLPDQAWSDVWDRGRVLLAPLFEGSVPLSEWLRRQVVRIDYYFARGVFLAACVGLGLLLWPLAARLRKRAAAREKVSRPSLAFEFLGGGFLLLFAFYTHTADGEGRFEAQTIFLLNLVPAVCLLAAYALDALGKPLARLRGGFAPLVLVTSFLCLPAVLRTNEVRRIWREPVVGAENVLLGGTRAPLPRNAGDELRALLPAGSVGFYPRGLGLHIATAFYAWRTLIPADRESWERARVQVEYALGLGDAPRYTLFPRHLPAQLRPEWESIHADLEEQFEMLAESEHWELWPSFD